VRSSVDQWSEAWPALVHLPVGAQDGGALALRHPLRALDAIHVAAALALRQAMPEAALAFASFDARQVVAARAEGLAVLEPPATAIE
jgi:predicted nucleic acid-binding protein